ncbi:uncharacterized protein LOC132197136 isoform X2 [Neocloeon triangulifer]|uniref:uncharacterized protein LOC132197136 isoform X2 n=1 Tax=Neocloeon triangulifer TaxID=2078957 RepID=UPI00286F2F6C|nr:uncharacterized protein LOC132197136 isoform X2 [Neocloeon triangulifer]
MRRSASFTAGPSDHRPSRIPTPVVSKPSTVTATTPSTPTFRRRTGSLRLPSSSPAEAYSAPPIASPGVLRRTGSMRLPSRSPCFDNKDVWGVGSGSWGKRQQLRRQQQGDTAAGRTTGLTSPLSTRGSNTSIDKLHLSHHHLRRPYEDDDDLCSEVSYDSTMSMDRTSSRRYVVHCPSDLKSQQNGTPYLTPTQRTALLNKELKAKLKQAMEDVSLRDLEISRLTQECVELRMKHARLSVSPEQSPTPSGIEKDSLNSSVHSELPAESNSVSIISEEEPRDRAERRDKITPPLLSGPKPTRPDILNLSFTTSDGIRQQPDNCLFNSMPVVIQVPVWPEGPNKTVKEREDEKSVMHPVDEKPKLKQEDCTEKNIKTATKQESDTQTDPDDIEMQLKAAQDALIETKVSCSCTCSYLKSSGSRIQKQLDAEQAMILWRAAQTQVQLSRLRKAADNSQAEVTLKFLKSAFFHLITDSSQGMTQATKSHWRAIQSILGFSHEESQAMDAALAAGAFPGSTW